MCRWYQRLALASIAASAVIPPRRGFRLVCVLPSVPVVVAAGNGVGGGEGTRSGLRVRSSENISIVAGHRKERGPLRPLLLPGLASVCSPSLVRQYETALPTFHLDWVDAWGNLLAFPETFAERLEVKTDALFEVSTRRSASHRSLQARPPGSSAARCGVFPSCLNANCPPACLDWMQAVIRGTTRGYLPSPRGRLCVAVGLGLHFYAYAPDRCSNFSVGFAWDGLLLTPSFQLIVTAASVRRRICRCSLLDAMRCVMPPSAGLSACGANRAPATAVWHH